MSVTPRVSDLLLFAIWYRGWASDGIHRGMSGECLDPANVKEKEKEKERETKNPGAAAIIARH